MITNKRQYLELAQQGLMGNQISSWTSVEEAKNSGYHGLVMIRYLAPNSTWMRPDVPLDDVPDIIKELTRMGANPDLFYLTSMTPGLNRTFGGEVWESERGLYLYYSRMNTHLREALDKDGHHAERVVAKEILRWACRDNDYDDLMTLLEMYPSHVIEFSVYENCIGSLPHRHMVIWEVRLY